MKPKICRAAVLLACMTAVSVPARQQQRPLLDAMRMAREKTSQENDWSELAASMEKMHAAMESTKPSGNHDLDFVQLMLPHHRAAIEMAETQLLYGKDPQVRRLAQEIITDQKSEIDLMELWLKQHKTQK